MAQALRSVSPSPSSASIAPMASWPIPGDAPDLRVIVEDQAATIEAQEALLHAYQGVLNTAQNPLPGTAATATGTATGNQLSLGNVVGTVVNGAVVTDGVTVPTTPPTTILGQISGTTGGNGIYLTSAATTASNTPLTITPPPPASSWPTPTDAPTLMAIQQAQMAVLRNQSALLQQYQDLLAVSGTPAPPTGP